MSQAWNPVSYLNHCYNVQEALPEKAVEAFLRSSKAIDIHYEGWLDRRRWTTLVDDPKRLPEYILASYLSETIDIVQLAKDIPLLGNIIPSKKWILLPARLIAMARLIVDCREQHELISKKCEEFQKIEIELDNKVNFVGSIQKKAQGWFDEPLINSPWNHCVQIVQDPASSLLARSGASLWLGLVGAQIAVTTTLSGPWDYVTSQLDRSSTKVKHLQWLVSAYHELAMRYAHLDRTARGDEFALKDALLRMPEHLEVLAAEKEPVLDRLINFCQQHWLGVIRKCCVSAAHP